MVDHRAPRGAVAEAAPATAGQLGALPAARWRTADTEQSIPERFADVVQRLSAKTSIQGADWRPSFAELDAVANAHAHRLLERNGRGSGGRIALLLRHDAPLLAAVLGVLKAGKAAVAMNASDPPARIGQIRRQTRPELLMTDARNVDLALRSGFDRENLMIVPDSPSVVACPQPRVAVRPDAIAFVIYTSGSTGEPKGVMQSHRNILHNVLRYSNGLGVSADDRVALLASLSGGQGLATACTTLLNGAELCPFPIMDRGMTGLGAWLAEHEITVLDVVPSVFRNFARTLDGERFPQIRLVRLASEAAMREDFDAFRRHFGGTSVLASTLASSEAGIIAQQLYDPSADPPSGRLPVGRAAEGVEVMLLDESGAEVAPGLSGEIVLRGAHLSPGYFGNDALTAARFASDGSNARTRVLHTGDLARRSSDGELTVVGRNDTQVKVSGNRVELAEVENAMLAQPQVAAAAVAASPNARGDTKLTAYVIAVAGCEPTASELRTALSRMLPGYAVPSAFAFVDSFPTTPHGKLDRARLAEIEVDAPPSDARVSARSETEAKLATIWSDAFELEPVGRDDDFFDLGGDSLMAAVVAADVHAAFGVELDLRAFSEQPTLSAMAQLIERSRPAATEDDPRGMSRAGCRGPFPLSFAQERTWQACPTPEASVSFNMPAQAQIVGPLDVAALRRSIDRIARRHEMLRTTFVEMDGRAMQVVGETAHIDLPVTDLRATEEPAEQAVALLAQEAREPFDLERGPLLRLRLVQTGDDEYLLQRVSHHLISDAWSWSIFFKELGLVYEAELSGRSCPLEEELHLHYGDFALWERRELDPAKELYNQQLSWWMNALSPPPEPLVLPFLRPAPVADVVPSDGVLWWGLDPEVSRQLDLLARRAGATYFMSRMVLFAAQVAIETDRDEIVFGTYVANRRRAETQAMFGFFTNLATLRMSFERGATLGQALERARAIVSDASAHAQIPYAQLSQELAEVGMPMPEIRAIVGVTDRLRPMRFGGLQLTPMEKPLHPAIPWGLTCVLDRWYEADRCRFAFDARIYDPAGVRSFVAGLQSLAGAACAHPDRPLRELARP